MATSLSLPESSGLTLLHDTSVTPSPGPLRPVSALGALGHKHHSHESPSLPLIPHAATTEGPWESDHIATGVC